MAVKGKYTVKISNSRVSYTMELERNITILTGESGIGKTALIRLVQNYEERRQYWVQGALQNHRF